MHAAELTVAECDTSARLRKGSMSILIAAVSNPCAESPGSPSSQISTIKVRQKKGGKDRQQI